LAVSRHANEISGNNRWNDNFVCSINIIVSEKRQILILLLRLEQIKQNYSYYCVLKISNNPDLLVMYKIKCT